ncbi:AGE family epimerase/isomerase [Nocardioides sp. LHG3406-4]|uniref:AGE family epimerase/isomerase n=1 Tax=Nocardioides sp. LHG3406-4 TaxID=2804575 RepID=UPI003CFACDEF
MSAPDEAWLTGHRRSLLDVATASRHPAGGFGWLDRSRRLVVDHPVPLWITCRMTYVFALAALHEGADTADLVGHGLDALDGPLHDDVHGGWFAAIGTDGPVDDSKRAYDHAFVVLAASAALAAGHERARTLLAEALGVLERRFLDEATGLYADVFDRAFVSREPYLGANANMHLVEALLAAADATATTWPVERALQLAERIVHRIAPGLGHRLPEHLDESGRPVLDYHRDEPAHPFRPYGVTVGHQLEWSRLLVQLSRGLGPAAPAWLLDDARGLFDRAVADGWSVDGAEGFVYTVDFDGEPVVHERMHWVVAEAISAARVLDATFPGEGYGDRETEWWVHARRYFVDPAGAWHHELDRTLRPAHSVWDGKPDVYHAYQAALLPRTGVATSFVSRPRDRATGPTG